MVVPSRGMRTRHRLYSRTYAQTRWYVRHVTTAGSLVLAGVALTAAIGLDTTLAMDYQAFALLLMVLLCAVAGRRWLRVPALVVERRLPRLAAVGTPLTYTITLHNPTRRMQQELRLREWPADPRPALALFAGTPEPGERARNAVDRFLLYYRWLWLVHKGEYARMRTVPVPPIPAGGRQTVSMELLPLHRGVLHLEGVDLALPEPLGLLQQCRTLAHPANLIILPKRYPLPPLALPGSRRYQPGGVALAGQVGDSEEFIALRDYQPGDTRRQIHYRSWARTGRPVVKEFESEFFVRHALILDTFCTPAERDLFEAAVSVAASFACTLDTQESLLDLLFVGTEAYCFTAGRGIGYREQLLTVLASVDTCTRRPFEDLAGLVLPRAGAVSGVVCVFVSWDDARQALVRRLQAMGVPVLVCVLTVPGAPRLSPGPMAANPQEFHQLDTANLAAGLARLGQSGREGVSA
jgi:uncharacterized protein (DUF58 family)